MHTRALLCSHNPLTIRTVITRGVGGGGTVGGSPWAYTRVDGRGMRALQLHTAHPSAAIKAKNTRNKAHPSAKAPPPPPTREHRPRTPTVPVPVRQSPCPHEETRQDSRANCLNDDPTATEETTGNTQRPARATSAENRPHERAHTAENRQHRERDPERPATLRSMRPCDPPRTVSRNHCGEPPELAPCAVAVNHQCPHPRSQTSTTKKTRHRETAPCTATERVVRHPPQYPPHQTCPLPSAPWQTCDAEALRGPGAPGSAPPPLYTCAAREYAVPYRAWPHRDYPGEHSFVGDGPPCTLTDMLEDVEQHLNRVWTPEEWKSIIDGPEAADLRNDGGSDLAWMGDDMSSRNDTAGLRILQLRRKRPPRGGRHL